MKKFFAVLFCVILVFSAAVSAHADVIVQYEDWALSSIDNGSAWEIRGYNGEETDVTLINYVGKVRVISVGSLAFQENSQVVSVTGLPLLQIIKEYAFLDAAALESVALPYSVYRIDRGAFYGAGKLSSINLQDTSVQVIREDTFRDTALTEITLPTTCTSIGNSAFTGCSSLEKVTIPDSVTEIADNAFAGSDKVVIYCNTASYAHEYAEANGIAHVLLDGTEPEKVTFLCGDSDGDGEITIVDATKIQRVLAELDEDPDGMIALRGDSDEDGLYITDATMIQRYLASYVITAPVGETLTRPKPVINA